MIILRKRFAGPRSRHMLLPALLFVLGAVASLAANSGSTRALCAGCSVVPVATAGGTTTPAARGGA